MIVEPPSGLDRSTLRDRALSALRDAITSGQYRPGDHLGEVELATRLGVSRGTVRQALRHLQQEGLVSAGNRSMLRVNSLSGVEVQELFRVRAALEGLAVRQIVASSDREASVAVLRDALSQLADESAEFGARVDTDLGFHLKLCELSGNSMLVDTWRHLEGRMRIVIMSAGPDRASTMMSQAWHELIVDAIDSGNVPDAVTVLNEHMVAAADHLARGSH
jgi:DNA-binding GntR family transcriptional regulator